MSAQLEIEREPDDVGTSSGSSFWFELSLGLVAGVLVGVDTGEQKYDHSDG